jgi:hypothetical protein
MDLDFGRRNGKPKEAKIKRKPAHFEPADPCFSKAFLEAVEIGRCS